MTEILTTLLTILVLWKHLYSWSQSIVYLLTYETQGHIHSGIPHLHNYGTNAFIHYLKLLVDNDFVAQLTFQKLGHPFYYDFNVAPSNRHTIGSHTSGIQ